LNIKKELSIVPLKAFEIIKDDILLLFKLNSHRVNGFRNRCAFIRVLVCDVMKAGGYHLKTLPVRGFKSVRPIMVNKNI